MSSPQGLDLPRVAVHLQALWGVQGELRRLAGYEDENFEVRGPQGHFVFRVSNVSVAREDLEFQNAAMRGAGDALADRYPGGVPRPVPSEGGRELEAWPDEPARLCRLLTWVPGQLWAHARPHGLEAHAQLGALLAHLDLALREVQGRPAPAGFAWDLINAGEVVAAHLGELVDPARRALVATHAERFAARVDGQIDRFPRALLHNDANDYNVLVQPGANGQGPRVSGLIDFGDSFVSLRAAELAIACAYAVQGEHDPLACVHALVAAYVAVHPLEALELEALGTLMAMRLCTTVVLAAKNQRLDPDNAYLQVSAAPAWRALEQLEAAGEAQLAATILAAAAGEPRVADPGAQRRASMLAQRADRLSAALSLSYGTPLHMVRGRGAHLFDAQGRAFVDGVNNVCHVGHAHPHVVQAAARQMARLNTNTRYLHDAILQYSERLLATMPDELEVVFLVCSGSEANDLALRMARTVTQRRGAFVLDHAYHGNTSSLIELSPYKFNGRGGQGPGPDTHVLAMPDPVRPLVPRQSGAPMDGPGDLAGEVQAHGQAFTQALASGPAPALFMAESLLGCGGQVELPPDYLQHMYALARGAGALCLADEVQVGFGRVGTHFWGFETQGVRPDIVTLGKPIGNGHPLAAVVTTRAVAQAFANGMEYFNTFGGNPVSAQVGLAVLDVIENEGLQAHALSVGTRLREALAPLQRSDTGVADVRGRGLFLGVELVRDKTSLQPDPARAAAIVEHAVKHGVLLSRDGPHNNVLKIKPPLVITEQGVDQIHEVIRDGLAAHPVSA